MARPKPLETQIVISVQVPEDWKLKLNDIAYELARRAALEGGCAEDKGLTFATFVRRILDEAITRHQERLQLGRSHNLGEKHDK